MRTRFALLKTVAIKMATALSLIIAVAIQAAAPLKAEGLANPASWLSDKETNHPLVGKIWGVKEARFVSPEELQAALLKARFVLLGELHDNPDHHTLQAAVINSLSKDNKKPTIVMEMIRVDQMQTVEAFLAQEKPEAKYFGQNVRWQANGWPDWKIYQPIGEAIVKNKLEIYPGSPSRLLTSHLIKKEIFSMPENQKAIFKLNTPLEADLRTALVNEVRTSHCNKLPAPVIEPMADVQRFRDAFMADVMISAAKEDEALEKQAILIAGSGHTRADRAVPWFLNVRKDELGGKTTSLSIQFVEATAEAKEVKALSPLTPKGTIAADYIWVTPAKSRGNYCDSIPDFGK